MGTSLLVAYVVIAALFALVALRERRSTTSGLMLFLAVAAWPLAILVVLGTIVGMALGFGNTEHRRSPVHQ